MNARLWITTEKNVSTRKTKFVRITLLSSQKMRESWDKWTNLMEWGNRIFFICQIKQNTAILFFRLIYRCDWFIIWCYSTSPTHCNIISLRYVFGRQNKRSFSLVLVQFFINSIFFHHISRVSSVRFHLLHLPKVILKFITSVLSSVVEHYLKSFMSMLIFIRCCWGNLL